MILHRPHPGVKRQFSNRLYLHFLMVRMVAAARAELPDGEFLRLTLLILAGGVVAPLARVALKTDQVSHFFLPRRGSTPRMKSKAHDGNRTHDLFLTKEVLYRLSYVGAFTLPAPETWSGKRDSNPRPRAWKARALPTELFPHPIKRPPEPGGEGRIRTSEGVRRQIYSLLPLATREPLREHKILYSRAISRWRESNSQPTDYKSVALPLSYIGPIL